MKNFKRPKWSIYSNSVMVRCHTPPLEKSYKAIDDGWFTINTTGMYRPQYTTSMTVDGIGFRTPFTEPVVLGNEHGVTFRNDDDIGFFDAPPIPPPETPRQLRLGEYVSEEDMAFGRIVIPAGTRLVPDRHMNRGYTLVPREVREPRPLRATPQFITDVERDFERINQPEESRQGMFRSMLGWFGI